MYEAGWLLMWIFLCFAVVTVLVIEAGPLDRGEDGILIPGAFSPWLYFWPGLVSTPQAGLNNRTVDVITAQVVGGGSTINAMVYLRYATQATKYAFLRSAKRHADSVFCSGVTGMIMIHGVPSGTRAGAGIPCSPISSR